MIVYPHAKINLGLRILRRRPDGYHDLETFMLPIGWSDQLSVEIAIGASTDSYHTVGLEEGISIEDNLIYKALQLLRSRHYEIPPLCLTLVKHIPTQAGLGGGSSDAAYTLLAVNELCALGLSTLQLEMMASLLGSDCPFFIQSRPTLATGRGEILTPLDRPAALATHWLLVAKPSFGISTAEAYSHVSQHPEAEGTLCGCLQSPLSSWSSQVINDFEPYAFVRYPELRALRDLLYQYGATYAAMSGSGTAIYAFFESNPLDDSQTYLREKLAYCDTWIEALE